MTETAPAPGAAWTAFKSYFAEFTVLRQCPRNFWVVQLVNLLDGVAYFAMMTVSTLYLSETLGFSDDQAAWVWAASMLAYTFVGFIAGFVGDSLGIKRTLYISVVLLVVSRVVISFTTNRAVAIPALFVIQIGTAIMTPILISATKRYTTAKTQTPGFNMLYFLMNVGAFLGNFLLDPLRGLPGGNRSVFMLGSAMSILCWLTIMLLWSRAIDDSDEQSRRAQALRAAGKDADATAEHWEPPWKVAASVFRESAFWRFMLFLVVLTGVRLVFEHQNQVYPKYYQRTLSQYLFHMNGDVEGDLDAARLPDAVRERFAQQGRPLSGATTVEVNEPNSRWQLHDGKTAYYLREDEGQLSAYGSNAPIGLLNAINPVIICFGVILSTPIVARFKVFNVMLFGICISAGSMLLLAIDPRWLAQVFGASLTGGYLTIVLAQIVVFSIGEVIWSPRLYEYTAAIAPAGREASYMGLSSLPMFLARFVEGPLAGYLLLNYCPADVGGRLATLPYAHSPQFMNAILAVVALSTPVLVVLLRGVTQKEARKAL